MQGRRFWGLVLSVLMALVLVVPAFAGGRDIDPKRDLQGISPKRHRYIFSVLGGAAVGVGIGFLMGGAPSMTKGAFIGGGLLNDLYLMKHHNAAGSWTPMAWTAGNTALGSGLGWTACKCGDGAVAGALIGGGGTMAWQAFGPRRRNTAQNVPQP